MLANATLSRCERFGRMLTTAEVSLGGGDAAAAVAAAVAVAGVTTLPESLETSPVADTRPPP